MQALWGWHCWSKLKQLACCPHVQCFGTFTVPTFGSVAQAWLVGVTGDVSMDISGTSQSYIDAASDAVTITGQVSGVSANSYTQARS